MNNNKKEKDTSNQDFHKGRLPSDYKFLLEKLRGISEIISMIEKKFFKEEI